MPKVIKIKPKWKLIILLVIIILAMSTKTNEIQATQEEEPNKGLGTPESPWDISEKGDGSLKAILSADGTLTISGKGEMKDWNYNGADWYEKQEKIKKVKIQKGVMKIGNYAFYGCSSLTSINIPETVTSIGWYAFFRCSSLMNIDIPETVTSIEERTFHGCSSLTSINIPKGITSIGEGAFDECSSLKQINIPEGVTSLGDRPFSYCSNLTNIVVDNKNQSYMSENGVLFNKERTLLIKYPEGKRDIVQYSVPEEVISIEEEAFQNCILENIHMPDEITSIEKNTFNGCSSLTKINIPEGVTKIGDDAFRGCSSIEEINIPEGVTSIGSYVFENCTSLKRINLPKGLEYKGIRIFYGCSSLESIHIPEDTTEIESETFYGCTSLKNINIPEGVTKIGMETFGHCESLTQINLPEGVTSIRIGAFHYCKNLTQVNIPEGVTSIEEYAFEGCTSLTQINIPEGVTMIEQRTFNKCSSLKSIKIPETVTSLGKQAFKGCSSLTSITLPEGMTQIKEEAFSECSNLMQINIPKGVTNIEDNVFSKCIIYKATGEKLKIPEIVKRAIDPSDLLYAENIKYTNCNINEQSGEIIRINQNEKAEIKIESGKLQGLQYEILKNEWDVSKAQDGSIKAVLTEEGILTISGTGEMKDWDFTLDTNWQLAIEKIVNQIVIEEGITSIGNCAFEGCKNLIQINLPKGLNSIGKWAFDECRNLTQINIPEGITKIERGTFRECSSLTNITIPEGVTSIGIEAFCDCKNLVIEEIPKSVKEIGGNAFYGAKVIQVVDNGQAKEQLLEFPELIKKYNTTEEFTLIGCELNEDKTKIKVNTDTIATKEVKLIINGGTLNGLRLVVEIPTGTIAYSTKNTTNQEVIATVYLTGNKKIINNEGKDSYTFTENGEFIFEYEDEERNLQKAKAMVNNIDNIPPDLQITYDKTDATNQKVTVTIKANEFLQEIEGWALSEDKMTLTKQYNDNQSQEITVRDLLGNDTKVTIEVENIDKIAPSVVINKSITDATNQKVTVTIKANEPLQEIEGWALSEDKVTLTKEYSRNETEEIIIKDLAGNQIKEIIKIQGIIENIQKGDPNNDRKIDSTDVITLLRHIAANSNEQTLIKYPKWLLTGDELKSIDIKEDGKIDSTDTIKLLRYIAAMKSEEIREKHPDWIF